MARKPLSIGRGLVSLSVGILVVFLVGCSRNKLTVTEVTVGPTSCDLAPPTSVLLHINQHGQSDQIEWGSTPTGQRVSIVFKTSLFPVNERPFLNMTQNTAGDWVANNPSGPINPALSPGPGGLAYKYDQTLAAQAPCDGRIIIMR